MMNLFYITFNWMPPTKTETRLYPNKLACKALRKWLPRITNPILAPKCMQAGSTTTYIAMCCSKCHWASYKHAESQNLSMQSTSTGWKQRKSEQTPIFSQHALLKATHWHCMQTQNMMGASYISCTNSNHITFTPQNNNKKNTKGIWNVPLAPWTSTTTLRKCNELYFKKDC